MERGFRCVKTGVGVFALLISLFHFRGIFLKKNGGEGGGGSSEPPELFGIHVSKVQQTVQITTINRLCVCVRARACVCVFYCALAQPIVSDNVSSLRLSRSSL